MPRVSITFKLPDEEEEHKMAIKASDYYCALHDLYQMFRTERKYGEDRWSEVEAKFWEILKDNDVEV